MGTKNQKHPERSEGYDFLALFLIINNKIILGLINTKNQMSLSGWLN